MFGNLIGYGDYGFVYEDETELNGPDGSVVKIVNLENICNEQQYNMFNQIMNHQNHLSTCESLVCLAKFHAKPFKVPIEVLQ